MSRDSKKRVIKNYLRLGQRRKAIDYIIEVYQVSDAEAKKLITALDSDVTQEVITTNPTSTPPSTAQGCAGCFGVVLKLVSVFFMFISLIMFIAVGLLYYVIAEEKNALVEVDAEIIELRQNQNEKIHPIVQYEWDGKAYTYTIDYSVDEAEFEVGQLVIVFIHPEHPERAYLEKDLTISFLESFRDGDIDDANDFQILDLIRSGITFVLLIPGLIFLILSIVIWQVSRKLSSKT